MLNAIIMMFVLGAILGLGLGVASKFLHVQPDERVDVVAGMLPGYNCGGCGYPGCKGFATAMVEGDTDEFKCRPCKADKKAEIITYLKENPGPDGKAINIKG